jgi:hypothetical protein
LGVAAGCSVFLCAACSAGTGSHRGTPSSLPPDPRTAAALLGIAATFNRQYGSGDYGPVYDRWDARSKAIISRAAYIHRHRECPTAPSIPSRTESATQGPHGAWLVRYEISGVQLTDYWFYILRRWVFDLVLSNPDAVRLYRLSARRYVVAVGCAH